MPDFRTNQTGKGKLFVVSAPSGAGKTTICNALRKRIPELAYSVSHTTRAPRKNEIHGRDYYFVSEKTFDEKIKQGKWTEWAVVHGNYYGTCAEQLNGVLDAGRDILLDIDVAGARQVKARYPCCITIFIMPPSFETLEKRLTSRGTDSAAEIQKRIRHAREEMANRRFYDHVVTNDRIEDAVEALRAVIERYTTNPAAPGTPA